MVEDTKTEYKSDFSDGITKTVVAFSNTDGGTIFVGVDDQGKTIGLADADKTALRCVQSIRDDVRPDVSATTDVDTIRKDDMDIVRISVSEGSEKPYYLRAKGLRSEGVYVRRGPSSVTSTEQQFNKMIRWTRSVSHESLLSMNQSLTFTYAENVFAKAGLHFDDIHKNILGIKTDSGYTNLGFLISDQCDYQIKAAVFSDERKMGFIDRLEITGSLLKQFDDVMSFIRKHSTVSSEIVGIRRIDHPEFPEEAVREIVLNAIMHRDYNSVGNTLVSICSDSLEIASPGSLVEDISETDLMKGASYPRNRKLSELFYRLGLVEAYGTGIPRVLGVYSNSAKKPRFDIGGSIFRVTLYSMNDDGSFDIEEKRFTRGDIEKKYCISKSKATMMINQMISEGKVIKKGVGKSTYYLFV